jgi:poly(beta-D-mannuronate) lyase
MPKIPIRRLPFKRAAATVLTLPGLLAWQVAASPPAVHASDSAAVRPVAASSAAQLSTALTQARPGDRIELSDGVVAGGTIRIKASGTAAAPITIAAQHAGGAELRAGTTFDLAGSSHVTIEGFHFNGATLDLPPSAFAVRVTRSTFTGGATDSVTVSTDDAEIDHNTFRNKTSQSVYLQITGPGAGIAKRTRVHHNYFFNHSFSGENGGESIRIGYSHKQHQQAFAVIENNLFERANGDPEAISVKSSDNIIRYNTLRDGRGEITLRHGWRNRVEGNYILGGVSGIRFYGNDHVIINNVIQNNTGQSINVGGGDIRDDTTSTTSHEAADRCLVAFNTLVGNQGGLIAVGPAYALAPDRITLVNNISVGTGTLTTITKGTNLTWQGNIVFRGTPGMPASGYRLVDPRLAAGTGGLNRLQTGSPAIDTSVGSYPQVTLDMDGVARTGAKDVGADEFSATGTQRRPLLPADVGPSAP